MATTVLDLFAGEGGAAMGYMLAGFDTIGIDNSERALKRYPGTFTIETDWQDGLNWALDVFGDEIALIHASPPCQKYSILAKLHPEIEYPDLILPVLEALIATGKPYVIENVPGAPLINPFMLCGSMFDLETDWPAHGRVGLKRHRLFESTIPVPVVEQCLCRDIYNVPVYGHNPGGNRTNLRGLGYAQAAREVMQINWMTRDGLCEAIPPAYTEYIGNHVPWLVS
jgi:DNA (cytosine-5)-methyltransferase 1